MEEAHNWLDEPSEEGNLTKYQEGLDNLLCTPERTLEGKVWPKGLSSIEGNTSLCWVCRYCGGQARSCVGVHSSMVELTSLANNPFHPFGSLINPNIALA